jgi:hypothetical protein
MSDLNRAHAVKPEPEREVDLVPRRRSRAQCCRFCSRENVGDIVDAGGDIGRVHRACFIAWDREQEALEMSMAAALSLPDPREEWTERDLEPTTVSRAA